MMLSAILMALAQPEGETRIIFPQANLGEPISPDQALPICEDALLKSQTANAITLLRGAMSCSFLDRDVDGSYLFNIGTVRGTVDYEMLLPADAAESDKQQELLLVLYYQGANVGSDDVIRDDAMRRDLVSRLQSWSPALGDDYDPGWKVGERKEREVYFEKIGEWRDGKLEEIRRVAVLVGDDEYWRLHQQQLSIFEKLAASEGQDPADQEQIGVLQQLKVQRGAELGDPGALAALRHGATDSVAPLESDRAHPDPQLPASATILRDVDSEVVTRCRDHAKRDALSTDGKLLAETITNEPGIGIVYRADVEDGSAAPFPLVTRHYCSSNFTGSMARDAEIDGEIEPLPLQREKRP